MKDYESLYVVGIGASAGGFEAFQKFLSKLPENSNISYVIAQHLDPNQPTLFGELLSKYSSFKITPVEDGAKIKTNHIYYCPPNKDVTIKNGIFKLSIPEKKSYPKPSINKFFTSLALDKKDKAVGIILSGTGSDGAQGMVEIEKHGGIVLTEDEGAKYYSMPKAAIDATKVIASLPPELLAEGIEHVIVDRKYFDKHFAIQDSTSKIFDILNKKTDIDFSSYKDATLTRRIKKRMNESKSNGVDSYLKVLQSDENEVERLKDELLIIVTSFFRDKEAFCEIKKYLRTLIQDKMDNTLRIWVPGCATGEEAYSIAIIICELFEELNVNKKVTIFATDVSEKIITKSRTRCYTLEQVENIDKVRLDKYFECKNDIYKPNKMLRDMIVFSKHDLIKDPPFLNLDLISCRNLLIYFNSELQKRILSIFYYAMRYQSLLFLGKSETVGSLSTLFSILHNKYKIYRKSNDMAQIDIDTLSYVKKINLIQKSNKREIDSIKSIDVDFSINHAVSNIYGKDGVVVNGINHHVLYYKGDCKDYLKHPQGIHTNDIFRLIVDYLKLDLRATINEAKKRKVFVISKKIRVLPISEPKEYITIGVFPLEKNKLGDDTFFVTFNKEIDESYSFLNKEREPVALNNLEVNILEDELSILKERLQITIEELETSNEELQSTNEELQSTNEELQSTNEELQSTNEELQSTNEELQSTNEELETSNEELQSTNEELQTVNDELSFTNLELEFANKAFNNVLSNLDVYVMILDKNLNIVKHTDGIVRFFDISKSHDSNFSTILLHSNVHLPNLLEDIKESLLHNKSKSYDIEYNSRNYIFSVKKIDIGVDSNHLDEGIVLSFVDITDITKKDQILLQQSKMAAMGEMIANIAHQWRQPLNALSLNSMKMLKKFDSNTLTKKDMKSYGEYSNDLIQKMSSTIDDFRNFFQPNKCKEVFILQDAINEAIKFVADAFDRDNISLDFKCTQKYSLNAYKNELIQVILNILNNSKDAIINNKINDGKIVIKVAKKDENVSIFIQDNGGGIEKEVLKKIFEPYFTTKFESDGTGLGLYMSKMIMENSMCGNIKIENKLDGVLCTITIPVN